MYCNIILHICVLFHMHKGRHAVRPLMKNVIILPAKRVDLLPQVAVPTQKDPKKKDVSQVFQNERSQLYANLIVLLSHVTAQDLMKAKDKLLLLNRLEN